MINLPNISKLFILGFSGTTVPTDFARFIGENPPAGFLLLGENYYNLKQLKRLISDLRSLAGLGALFMVDQEPGRVQRFKTDFPLSRLPQYYVRSNARSEFRAWCAETAKIMADAGLNMNLAPVLDLCSFDKDYPVLNGRSFGEDSGIVIEYAMILIEEFRKYNILICGKHFPGLGSGKLDPHEMQAISEEPIEWFENYHLRPFRAVIEQKIPAIMTTHLLASSFDNKRSATYSPVVIDYLKEQLGHQGLVISDDLYMSGSGITADIGRSVIDCIRAGHHLLIISRDLKTQVKAFDAARNHCIIDQEFCKIVSDNEERVAKVFGQ